MSIAYTLHFVVSIFQEAEVHSMHGVSALCTYEYTYFHMRTHSNINTYYLHEQYPTAYKGFQLLWFATVLIIACWPGPVPW